MALYFDMLKNPRFQEDRIKLAKSQILQSMERRNDRTDAIEGREWARLMYGANHFSTKETTKASVEGITREDMVAFHQKYYQPGGFIFAVSGDFNTKEMIAKLEAAMKGWPVNKEAVPDVPKPTSTPVAGVYTVTKPDVNQGRVSIGHTGAMRDNPDSYAIEIMNDILGGGGFTSRITVARSFGRRAWPTAQVPASDSASIIRAFSAQRSSRRTRRPRRRLTSSWKRSIGCAPTKVTAEELETAKNSAIEVLPAHLRHRGANRRHIRAGRIHEAPADYWTTYRDRIRAVTADDVQRVAQKYLQPDKLVVLVVGNIDEITKGNPDKPQHSLPKIAKDGQIRRIPLPDPLTMVYPTHSCRDFTCYLEVDLRQKAAGMKTRFVPAAFFNALLSRAV